MRISKPSKTQDYIIYPDIAERNEAKAGLENGQVVKITDASGDDSIGSGWAIYKYDKKAESFDLLEQEIKTVAKPVIPDGITTIGVEGNQIASLNDLDLFSNLELMEDFTFRVNSSSGESPRLTLMPTNSSEGWYHKIPIKLDGTECDALFGNSTLMLNHIGDESGFCTWVVELYVVAKGASNNPSNSARYHISGLAPKTLLNTYTPKIGYRIPAVLVRAKLPVNGNWDTTSIKTYNLLKKYKKEELPELSNNSHTETNNGKITNLNSINTLPLGASLMQDFDFEIEAYSNGNLMFSFKDGSSLKEFPIKTADGTTKYLSVAPFWISTPAANLYPDVALGDMLHYHCNVGIISAKSGVKTGNNRTPEYNGAADLKHADIDSNAAVLMTVRIPRIAVGTKHDLNNVTLYKHWKNALAPAEERIVIPEVAEPVNYLGDDAATFLGVNNRFKTPDAMVSASANMRILEDFDYTARMSGGNLRLEVVGGARTIPIMVDGVKKYMSVTDQSMGFRGFDNEGKGKRVHWSVSAFIDDADVLRTSMSYGTHVNGEPAAIYPNGIKTQLCILQVSASMPANGDEPNPDNFIISKYWKKAVVPAEERISIPESTSLIPDEITIFEATLSEKQKIFAPALCQTHGANFRILEDFELKYEYGKVFNSTKTTLTVRPVDGNKQIPVLVDGVLKYMSLAQEAVIMPDVFGGGFANQWKYFVLIAKINDNQDTLSLIGTEYETNHKAGFVYPYPDDTHFKFVQVGVKFNADGDTVDFQKNLKVFKYWKNALAPINEIIDYKNGTHALQG